MMMCQQLMSVMIRFNAEEDIWLILIQRILLLMRN